LEQEAKDCIKQILDVQNGTGEEIGIVDLKKQISDKEFLEHSEDLEMILLENNVALEVADKILEELKIKIVDKELYKKRN